MSDDLRRGLEAFEAAAELGLAEGKPEIVAKNLDDLMNQITPVLLKMDPEVQDEIFERIGALRVRCRSSESAG